MDDKENFKIKLIFPFGLEVKEPYSSAPGWYLPYGMSVLAGFLRQHGYYVEQEDLNIKFSSFSKGWPCLPNAHGIDLDFFKNIDEIHNFLRAGEDGGRLLRFMDDVLDSLSIEKFDLVGFSVFSYKHFLCALMLSLRIKQRLRKSIVFGGPFMSFCDKLYPEAELFRFIDFQITGDGTVSLLKLIHYLEGKIPIDRVPNLKHRIHGSITVNHHEDIPLEDMPAPDFRDFPVKLYEDFYGLSFSKQDVLLPYQIARGCTDRCRFCSYRYFHKKCDFKSFDKVVTELMLLKKEYKTNRFEFCGEAINNSYEYLEGLCDVFINNRLDISWMAFAKIRGLDEHILRKLKKAGCYLLKFGVESGSNRLLEMMNKGFTAEEASQVLRWSAEAGMKNIISLIVGYPHEKQEDLRQTAEFIKRNRKYFYYARANIFALTFGSDMADHPDKYGVANLTVDRKCFIHFNFDESYGLPWVEKQKSQMRSKEQIVNAIRVAKFFSLAFAFLKLHLKSMRASGSRLLLRRNHFCIHNTTSYPD